jgi:hypothetical protein
MENGSKVFALLPFFVSGYLFSPSSRWANPWGSG